MARSRRADFRINSAITRIPVIQIPRDMYPAMDGVQFCTDTVKSFIQFTFPVRFVPSAWLILIPALEKGKLRKLSNQEESFSNLIRRKGTKGTANNPSSRNHRLYCIRPDRLFLNIFLTIRRRTTIPLINMFDRKKRIIK